MSTMLVCDMVHIHVLNVGYFVTSKGLRDKHVKYYHSLQITIDTTPPHPGVVIDGRRGQEEVNFQQDLTVHAHWAGFFDRESGVQFYHFRFGDRCYRQDEFNLNDKDKVNI